MFEAFQDYARNGEWLGLQNELDLQLTAKRGIVNPFKLAGRFKTEHWRNGRIIGKYDMHNDIVNLGKNTLFGVMFGSQTQIASTSWFIGQINSAGYTALAATDIMTSHAGWSEFTTYNEATRPAWGPGAAANQSITNPTPAQFTINASGTVQGVFIVTDNTKSGTAGILWATALYTAPVPVNNGDILKVTYTVSA